MTNYIEYIALIVGIFSFLLTVSLAIYLYLITKFLKLKEFKEKKRETMFSWVHENLIGDIYIPLAEYAWAISYTLSQKGYKEDIVLYRISKFLYCMFKNRAAFGGDMYFTPYEDSNRLLEIISGRIVAEINTLYDIQDEENPIERRIVILEFISTCAGCRNYSEFQLLVSGRPIANKDLTDETNKLRDGYSDNYLTQSYGDHGNIFLNPMDELINPRNIGQAWRKAKLYAYCILFNKLLMHAIYKMYDSWYVKHPKTLKNRQLSDTNNLVNNLVAEIDRQLFGVPHIYEKPYEQLQMNQINNMLKDVRKKLSSTTDRIDKEELSKQLIRLKVLKSIELLYSISQGGDMLKREIRSIL